MGEVSRRAIAECARGALARRPDAPFAVEFTPRWQGRRDWIVMALGARKLGVSPPGRPSGGSQRVKDAVITVFGYSLGELDDGILNCSVDAVREILACPTEQVEDASPTHDLLPVEEKTVPDTRCVRVAPTLRAR